jgi:drug/metabolite transporter (DMT)-like permease
MIFLNFIMMCMIFGTTFLAIKIGVDAGTPPFFSAGIRFFIAGFLLFVFFVWKGRVRVSLFFSKEMLITGICLTFGTFSTLYWAEQYVTSGVAAVLSATGPIMILILQTFILKEKGSWSSIIGCLIGIIGVAFLIVPGFSLQMNGLWIMGCLAVVLGNFCYASGTIYTKHVSKKFSNSSPVALNAVQMMHGGLLLVLLSSFTETVHVSDFQSSATLGSTLYLIVFGSMAGHSLYYWLVSRTNPVFPSTWLYISPLIAVVIGVMFYEEFFSWLTGVGALAIIMGTFLVNLQTLRGFVKKKENLDKAHVITTEI